MINNDSIFETKKDFEEQFRAACMTELGKTFEECSQQEQFSVLATLVASKGKALQPTSHTTDEKKV